MKVTFLVPSTKRAIGGVIALYEFANGAQNQALFFACMSHLLSIPASVSMKIHPAYDSFFSRNRA